MKRFRCTCGQRVFFDNTECLACGRRLGFDPSALEVVSLEPRDSEGGSDTGEGGGHGDAPRGPRFVTPEGGEVGLCRNARDFANCNWVIPMPDPRDYCLSCGFNEIIPTLSVPGNLALWTKVEQAKRRLLYTLLTLGLPLHSRVGDHRLRFRFLEDQRRNPHVREDFVMTGHLEGIITVNLAEADDATRHELRKAFDEPYRSVLGHLRHEAGHFLWGELTRDPADLDAFRRAFGDERQDYSAALQRYYEEGPRPDWPSWHLSAYASAHPHEDFAETFAHYLHITDALETAGEAGFHTGAEGSSWIDHWIDLSVTLNELNRSLGVDDPYPFVLSTPVVQKLELIHRLVLRGA